MNVDILGNESMCKELGARGQDPYKMEGGRGFWVRKHECVSE